MRTSRGVTAPRSPPGSGPLAGYGRTREVMPTPRFGRHWDEAILLSLQVPQAAGRLVVPEGGGVVEVVGQESGTVVGLQVAQVVDDRGRCRVRTSERNSLEHQVCTQPGLADGVVVELAGRSVLILLEC